MNDPGLEGPIDQASSQVKEQRQDEDQDPQDSGGTDQEEQDETSFLMPARWFFASTVIPLLAGTFGPMASAFNLCALVENWRVEIPPGGTEEHGIDIRDPRWIIIVNAISFASAIIGNIFLLLNMARRVRFAIAQPCTILGYWIASIMLIGLVITASTNFHAPGVQNQALTQAYYYAIFAAILYQIMSYLMCITVYGAYRGHYSKEFKLTVAQRTLMLQTIAFLVYQLLGALVYSHIEGWKFLDALYWADFTSLTIGVGADYVPTTHLGRSLLFPFAIGGIIILGLVVGSIRALVLDRGKQKLSARAVEKTRLKLLRQMNKHVNQNNSATKSIMGAKKTTVKALALQPGDESMSELERRRHEFEAMRIVQEHSAHRRKYYSLATSTLAFALLWFIGAFVFYVSEQNQQWSYFQSLYFAYTSLLTIGYGDYQPISNSGKPFFVFWSLLAIPTLTILISDMGDTVVKGVKDLTIWLGEVTVLPSDTDSAWDRLKHGLYKASFWQAEPNQAAKDLEHGDEEGEVDVELAVSRKRKTKPGKKGLEGPSEDDRSSIKTHTSGAESEIDKASGHVLDDVHEHRRLLMTHIRKVYSDSNATTPKKYSYKEWAFYLKLLGEDEGDSMFHRKAPQKPQGSKRNTPNGRYQDKSGQGVANNTMGRDDETEIVRWSWIGDRSPLMGPQSEPEFLLERLLQRMEDSLQQAGSVQSKQSRVVNQSLPLS